MIRRATLEKWAPVTALVVLSFAFRLPPLVNAASTNSDAAIVGLQALHVGRGELSFFLLGSTYQTSVDSFVAALFFLFLGPTPRALMLSSLSLHVGVTLVTYALLLRLLDRKRAFVLALLLVFTTAAVHSYALYPPREASIALAFAALFLLGRAFGGRRALLGAGCAVASLACFADPYAFVLMPMVAVVALSCIRAGGRERERAQRLVVALGAGSVGAIPLALLFLQARSKRGELGVDPARVVHNARIFVGSAWPWLVGTTPFVPVHMMDYAPWHAPSWLVPLQWLGATLFALGLFLGPVVALRGANDPKLRAFALGAGATVVVTLGGYATSVMIFDHFSMRYLASLVLVAPFAFAPIAARIDPRQLVFALAPVFVTMAVSGWVSYGPDVSGLKIVREPGASTDDYALGDALRARDVHAGYADYWVSYRLTFLYREDPLVVPTHASQDRYAPYRAKVSQAPVLAYVIDPLRSEERAAVVEERFRQKKIAFERLEVGRLTALIYRAPKWGTGSKDDPNQTP